jgi:DNA-binding CsgD family transcriptional regulator
MEREGLAFVVFGDVVRSRSQPGRSSAWLRRLRTELDGAFADDRLAPFDFTQGDEIQGLLAPSANPLDAVLRASLHPDGLPMRWVIAAGRVDPGMGRATQRTGPAFLVARDLLDSARTRRDGLRLATGDSAADGLLDDLAPVLPVLLKGLSPRQRIVARLVLIDRHRQAEAADILGVSRATVSVLAERGHVHAIAGLARGLRAILGDGLDRAWPEGR